MLDQTTISNQHQEQDQRCPPSNISIYKVRFSCTYFAVSGFTSAVFELFKNKVVEKFESLVMFVLCFCIVSISASIRFSEGKMRRPWISCQVNRGFSLHRISSFLWRMFTQYVL